MPTIHDRLARLGKELLGHGDAALVWGDPGEPFVVKVGWDGADGWPAWAAWCMAHPGPHVPIIHACHVLEHEGRRVGFVGVVERLSRAEDHRPFLVADRSIKHSPIRFAAAMATVLPGVASMLRDAAVAFPAARWDLTPSNWMARPDGTLVLSDPLCRAG